MLLLMAPHCKGASVTARLCRKRPQCHTGFITTTQWRAQSAARSLSGAAFPPIMKMHQRVLLVGLIRAATNLLPLLQAGVDPNETASSIRGNTWKHLQGNLQFSAQGRAREQYFHLVSANYPCRQKGLLKLETKIIFFHPLLSHIPGFNPTEELRAALFICRDFTSSWHLFQ